MIPQYIPIEKISMLRVEHDWDDWDPYELLAEPDENTKNKLEMVSSRGITAFSLGCAEWTIYRLSNHFNDPVPHNYIEAFWVFLMGVDDALPPETENDDWEGNIRGPINMALMTTLNTIYLAGDGPPIQNGALSAQITYHVLGENSEFIEWQKEVLERFVKYCLRDEDNPHGDFVPREILDPSIALDELESKKSQFIQDFLNKVDYPDNPFLKHVKL